MKIHLRNLRKMIQEIIEQENKRTSWGGSSQEEDYDEDLLHDPGYKAKSVYVPDDVKQKIDKWAKKMRLTRSKE
jgi:hypothetical protein